MLISIISRLDGWMGLHISHFSNGFVELGHNVDLVDYHSWDKRAFPLLPGKSKESFRIKIQTNMLINYLRVKKPDIVIIIAANHMYDYKAVKDSYHGKIIFFDMDGPAAEFYKKDTSWINQIDMMLSVSRQTERTLAGMGYNNVRYIPHGVDTNYYSPLEINDSEKLFYGSKLAFLGRPDKRRFEYLKKISKFNLTVWGSRWSKKPYINNDAIKSCIRSDKNVAGLEVVKLYQSASVMTNILRDPLSVFNTVMSLQVFSIPSCGACLLTEWVEEIPESFEPGREILTFSGIDDFVEKSQRYSSDTKQARAIGEAGRKRCLAEHTHKKRAEKILGFLEK